MPSGNVIIKVGTAGRLIPVEGATVFIAQKALNQNDTILAARKTDRSGETVGITVETPQRSLSESPGNDLPFTSVDIRVEHPLYYPHYISNAQIFADTQSVQNISLIPLAMPTEKITDNVFITPQNL